MIRTMFVASLALTGCECDRETQPPPLDSPASPAPNIDCKGVLEDTSLVDGLFQRARSRGYRTTRDECRKVTALLDARFDETWATRRRVPEVYQGKPVAADNARTLRVSGTMILLQLVCDGPTKLKREFGPNVVRDYERDLVRFVAHVRETCAPEGTR